MKFYVHNMSHKSCPEQRVLNDNKYKPPREKKKQGLCRQFKEDRHSTKILEIPAKKIQRQVEQHNNAELMLQKQGGRSNLQSVMGEVICNTLIKLKRTRSFGFRALSALRKLADSSRGRPQSLLALSLRFG